MLWYNYFYTFNDFRITFEGDISIRILTFLSLAWSAIAALGQAVLVYRLCWYSMSLSLVGTGLGTFQRCMVSLSLPVLKQSRCESLAHVLLKFKGETRGALQYHFMDIHVPMHKLPFFQIHVHVFGDKVNACPPHQVY